MGDHQAIISETGTFSLEERSVIKKNPSDGKGADGGSMADGPRQTKVEVRAALPKRVSVLDQEPQPHGLMKTWLGESSSLDLCLWRAATLEAASEVAASPAQVALVEAHFSGDRGIQCAYLLKRLRPELT